LTLLVHPDWLKGAPGQGPGGLSFGGSVSDDADSTARWNAERAKTLKLIEVRGKLPEEIVCPDTNEPFGTGSQGCTVPKKSFFSCMAATCGSQWDVREAMKKSKKSGPVAMYAVQGYCPACNKAGMPYSGRFFDIAKPSAYDSAYREWERRREGDLAPFWPRSEVPYGFMTSIMQGGIPNHGFTHWWTMFNPKQHLILAQLLRSIVSGESADWETREVVLGAFQQYLRNQNLFCIWDRDYDKLVPHMSNNNYHPKATMVENCVFAKLGRGNWASATANMQEGQRWKDDPWETVSVIELANADPATASEISGQSAKTTPGDVMPSGSMLACRSSSDLQDIDDASYDLVVTDPPFGGLLHYSELADFFYVWLRLTLKERYPRIFAAEHTPKSLEAVANRARNPEDADAFYQKLLTQCWREAARILKPSGILAFTFHHSEDEPWVAVLESLFDAGFYLEATYPIRSDETKGEGEFGSKTIEYDIIHVCRKRTGEPTEVSWARLRRQIMTDVRQLQDILTKHQSAGLQLADVQVIRRGKALEYYSKHYGKVYVERGREFTVREALLAINQLLDEQQDTTTEAPPQLAEAYTRQFFRLFANETSTKRDQMQKFLRGTGVSPQEFVERGWCQERAKVFYSVAPLEWARSRKGVHRTGISQDFDQVMFIVGACFEGSGIKLSDTLDNPNFKPHPATDSLLDWLTRHGGNGAIREAAQTGLQLYRSWAAKNQKKVEVERTLFDLVEEA
jgi:putative DNA methylase